MHSSSHSPPGDRSLTRGLSHINTMLAWIGLGTAMLQPSESHLTAKQRNTSVSCLSIASPPIKKQHKRTSSSPNATNGICNIGYRAPAIHSAARPDSLIFSSIPPLPVSSSSPPSTEQTRISHSDSHLLDHRHRSRGITSTPEEEEDQSMDKLESVQCSSTRADMEQLPNRSNSAQQLHSFALLDIDTHEQMAHRAKPLPPDIDRKTFHLSLDALERDFLR